MKKFTMSIFRHIFTIQNMIYLLLLVFFISCHKKGKDYKELYKERVIYTYIITPKPDPQTACIDSTKVEQTCISKTVEGKQQTIFNEQVYSYILSSTIPDNNTKFKDYSEYCISYLSSKLFDKFSDAAKQCTINCMKIYWQGQIDSNLCENQNMSNVYKNAVTKLPLCIRDCIKAVNN